MKLARRTFITSRLWADADSATIRRPTETTSPYGGQTLPDWPDGWTVVASNVPVRIAPVTQQPREAAVAGTLRSVRAVALLFPLGTDVQGSDRVTVGARTFEVVAPTGPATAAIAAALTVDATEIT